MCINYYGCNYYRICLNQVEFESVSYTTAYSHALWKLQHERCGIDKDYMYTLFHDSL